MALLFIDSFDHYTTVIQKWGTLQGAGIGTDTSGIGAYGRRGSNGFRLRITQPGLNGVGHTLSRGVPASGNTAILGMAFQQVTTFATNHNPAGNDEHFATTIARFRLGGVTQVWFRVNTNGTIAAFSGVTPSTQLGVTSVSLVQGAFTHVEFRVVISGTAGEVTVRFNGTTVLDVSGAVDTQVAGSATWNEFAIGQLATQAGVTNECRFDDVYVLDGTGPAPWNAFLGDCRVDALYPTAEGAVSDWTPSAGTDNALLVKETAPDGDATYVTSVTAGHTDTYVVPNVPVAGTSPAGVQVGLYVRKEEAGLCNLAAVVRHGGTNYSVAISPNPGGTYSYRVCPLATNPGTGVEWTEAEFDAAEFGFIRNS